MFVNKLGEDGFNASEEYLDGVENIENAKYFTLHEYSTGDKLEVEYKDGSTVFYQEVHGTWGFPTVLN